MDASMMQISYPASSRGVEIARIPSGAVASMLEKEATKKTIFFEDFTLSLLVSPQITNDCLPVCLEIVKTLQNSKSDRSFSLATVVEQQRSRGKSVKRLRHSSPHSGSIK
jgi:hypothetical protein